ncbi:MAG TPA: 23S rRNA (guanosine(2251)-2'-O)-methyltransferase RlmB [Pseudomonadales bacterium]|nr:23S rRNA (guanosine(2251)-2'-O)-methyltransferase RlmB [Pseudomonadales bacterium]
MMERECIHGIHAIGALLRRSPERVESLAVLRGRRDQRLEELLQTARVNGIAVRECAREELDRLAPGVHQGVVAQVRAATPLNESFLLDTLLPNLSEPALLLVLDAVTDPHNLGACLRSADAFGAHAVIVPRDNAAPLNATARKVASGAADVVPLVVVTNLARTLRALQQAGVWVVGAAGEAARALSTIDLRGAVALVMGAEGSGMRRLTREHCDHLAAIPMCGEVDSLNVSVATGVFLYEARRQRTT